MARHYTQGIILAMALGGVALPAAAADADRVQTQARDQQQLRDPEIYGAQMMTTEERNAFRNRMRTAKTAEERERIRADHHAQMKIRAKERGITLSDEPPANRGPGAGPGGGGMGPGGGAGRR